MWMLDTDTVSYTMRNRPAGVRRQFESRNKADLAISSIVLAELLYGAARRENAAAIRGQINLLVQGVTLLAWDAEAAAHFAEIRLALDSVGTPLAAQDLMIAAHARSLDAVLVTNNQKHFRRVPGLKLENWI